MRTDSHSLNERIVLSHTSAQRLRFPGYAIAAMLIVSQLVDIAVRSSPFRVHSPAWRLGYVSATGNESNIVLVALFLILLIAALTEDRIAALVTAGAASVLGLIFAVALIVFALDVVQFKGQVAGPLAEQYGMGAAWIGARIAIAVVLFFVLAIASLRVARTFAGRRSVAAADPAIAGRVRTTPPKAVQRV